MIEIITQAPWADNGGDYVFIYVDISIHQGHGRLAFGALGFLLGIVFHT